MQRLVVYLPPLASLWGSEDSLSIKAERLRTHLFPFAVVDQKAKEVKTIHQGGAFLNDLPKGIPLTLILNGVDVTAFAVQMPSLTRKKVRPVVEAMVEDRLPEGSSQSWIAYSSPKEGSLSGVYVVNRQWLVACLMSFVGIGKITAVFADWMMLPFTSPPPDGSSGTFSWSVYFDAENCCVRSGEFEGFVLPLSLAYGHFFGFLKQADAQVSQVFVSSEKPQWDLFLGGDGQTMAAKQSSLSDWKWQTIPAVNLLQDDLLQQIQPSENHIWLKRGLVVWGCVVGFYLFSLLWSAWTAGMDVKTLQQGVESQVRTVIPPPTPILDPVAQVKALWRDPRVGSEESIFVLMREVESSLEGASGKISLIEYTQGKLSMTFDQALSEESRQRVMQNPRLVVEWKSANQLMVSMKP
jgi:hypothetical protein